MKSNIVDPSTVTILAQSRNKKTIKRMPLNNGLSDRQTISYRRATFKKPDNFMPQRKTVAINNRTPSEGPTTKNENIEERATPIFLRQNSTEEPVEQTPKLYNRQEVFEAILRGKPLDNKRIWKEATIQYSPNGERKFVPLTQELRLLLGK
jgi:hypothetical protein